MNCSSTFHATFIPTVLSPSSRWEASPYVYKTEET